MPWWLKAVDGLPDRRGWLEAVESRRKGDAVSGLPFEQNGPTP
jgi:hypothetical protein